MFEPVLETGDIIEVDNKQYLVLGILKFDIVDCIQKERVNYIDDLLKNVKNMYISKTSPSYAIRNLYYYYLYYDSKTVKEFVTRVFAQVNRLMLCEYSSYPDNMKPDFWLNFVEGTKIRTKRKVGKIEEKDVKLNLMKGAFFNNYLANICTTGEVYEKAFSDVKDSKITKEQKDYLKSYLMQQLNVLAKQYDIAKNTLSDCIAEVCINNKQYLGYICFQGDHVNVYRYCNKNEGLKKKIELLFYDGDFTMLKLDYKDVTKVERVC